MRIAFLINGVIKRYRQIKANIENTFMPDFDCRLFVSEHKDHMEILAGEACQQGYDHLIIVGGDGTLNEAVNGFLSGFKRGNEPGPESFDWDAVKETKLGLLPAGSGNDFARFHDISHDLEELIRRINEGSSKLLDIGWTSFIGKDKKDEERFFFNIADVGMGGHTVQHMDQHRIGWLGPDLNYMKAIVSGFFTYKRSVVNWKSRTKQWEGEIMSLVIANGKYFGSGLGIAPDAVMDDGLFDIVSLGNVSALDYIRNLGRIRSGLKIEHPEVEYDKLKSITIESSDNRDLPIDMDGEFVGYCPMTLQCIQKAIKFIV